MRVPRKTKFEKAFDECKKEIIAWAVSRAPNPWNGRTRGDYAKGYMDCRLDFIERLEKG